MLLIFPQPEALHIKTEGIDSLDVHVRSRILCNRHLSTFFPPPFPFDFLVYYCPKQAVEKRDRSSLDYRAYIENFPSHALHVPYIHLAICLFHYHYYYYYVSLPLRFIFDPTPYARVLRINIKTFICSREISSRGNKYYRYLLRLLPTVEIYLYGRIATRIFTLHKI